MMEKQTIVVKVGTSSLTLSDGTMDAEKIRNITTQLADSSGSLFIGNFRRPFFKAETGKACGDRTRGNENHMVACRLQRGKLGRNVPYFFSIHRSV